LLVIFEAGIDFGDITAAIGRCGAKPGCENGTTGAPFRDILLSMAQDGALVIPAHVNAAKAGMLHRMSGQALVNAITDVQLHAIAVCPGETETKEQRDITAQRKPYVRKHPLAVVYADDVSDPLTLGKPGATTWFKLNSHSLSSLKLAVRTPETRVSVNEPSITQRSVIREITWTGGFLDDVTIPIAQDLTTLIGGRGTGKSTVIESLRYVLGAAPVGPAAKRDHEAIVKEVLRSGTTVRIVVDTVSPIPGAFTIERTSPNPPIVRDSSGVATQQKPSDIIGTVEVFGQHELAELASDKTQVARMLERFAGSTGRSADYDAVCDDLRENRLDLAKAERALENLDAELAEIPRLEEHEARYKETDLPTRLAERTQLDRDEAILGEIDERVEAVRGAVNMFVDDDALASLLDPVDGIDASPQRTHLANARQALATLAAKLDDLSAQATAAVDAAVTEVEAAEKPWRAATQSQRDKHDAVIRELVTEGHEPEKYLTIMGNLEALRVKVPKRKTAAARIAELKKARSELLGDLAGIETKQAKELNAAVKAANKKTGGVVIVKPTPAHDRQDIKGVVERHVSGQRSSIMAAIDDPDFSPRALAEAARSGLDQLAEFGIRGAQAAHLAAAGEACFRELEELTVGQAVDVQLDIAVDSGTREYRSIDQLSKGQRATALLLLLLGASTSPLIIDQPEDDLDNRFIYEGIVTKLRELKGSRQIIATTHNANVPVLGDAELIVALEGDGQHGRTMAGGIGSLDDEPIRMLAENLLEGGPAAFNARHHLYGF
jgi:ABC-type Mn2+/Zn2+ transport system ATPase subunit